MKYRKFEPHKQENKLKTKKPKNLTWDLHLLGFGRHGGEEVEAEARWKWVEWESPGSPLKCWQHLFSPVYENVVYKRVFSRDIPL